jgi:DNA processing protein
VPPGASFFLCDGHPAREASPTVDALPPREIDAFLVLNASGVAPRVQIAWVEALGSADAVLGAGDPALAAVAGTRSDHLGRLRATQATADIPGWRALCEKHSVRPVPFTAPEFPARLREAVDDCALLFVQGSLTRRDEQSIALVGTRKCSPYALTMAARLSADLARRGFTIVSGLALGVDGEAHRAAVEGGGRTVGVMASGPDITYPPDHRALRAQISGAGAVVTEYAFGTPPLRERFPARNRIIAGLSLGVVVVEAPVRSGALITARLAAEQGREVFAVPGDVTRPESHGCHALIKDGVQLVECAEDVVEGLGILLDAVPQRPQGTAVDLPSEEQALLDALSYEPRHVDEVVARSGQAAAQVSAGLMLLEMKGLVRRLPGSTFVRL